MVAILRPPACWLRSAQSSRILDRCKTERGRSTAWIRVVRPAAGGGSKAQLNRHFFFCQILVGCQRSRCNELASGSCSRSSAQQCIPARSYNDHSAIIAATNIITSFAAVTSDGKAPGHEPAKPQPKPKMALPKPARWISVRDFQGTDDGCAGRCRSGSLDAVSATAVSCSRVSASKRRTTMGSTA